MSDEYTIPSGWPRTPDELPLAPFNYTVVGRTDPLPEPTVTTAATSPFPQLPTSIVGTEAELRARIGELEAERSRLIASMDFMRQQYEDEHRRRMAAEGVVTDGSDHA